jgi:hypothetical protein
VNASPVVGGGNARALAEALRGLGVACAVEPRQALAIITVDAGSAASLATLYRRQAILAMAKEHGFTHVAVELNADPAGAGAPVLRP